MIKLSIVITSHNDAIGCCKDPHEDRCLICECLESIQNTLAMDQTPVELLIADDGSSDDTDAYISHWIRRLKTRMPVKYLCCTKCGGAGARLNDLIALAQGQYIVRIDADVVMQSPNWAARVVQHFADATAGGILGGVQLGHDGRVWAFGDSLFNDQRKYTHLHCGESCPVQGLLEVVDYNMMCFGAFPRRLWQQVGGFDPTLGRYEEVDFNLRCATHRGGHATYVTSDIVFIHYNRIRRKRDGDWDDQAAIEKARREIESRWGFDWRAADPLQAMNRWPGTVLATNAECALQAV